MALNSFFSSELSSGITTARGCGVGGDLVQYLQVELKLKRGKVKVSAGGTQTKNSKEESEGGQDFIPFSLSSIICVYGRTSSGHSLRVLGKFCLFLATWF